MEEEPKAPALPPLKMELVVRLVPLYMVQDTQAAGSEIPEASGVTCISWQTWRGGNLVDPFFVSLSGVPQEDAFLQHRHRVLSSTKTWRGVEQWSSVCTAEDRTPYRLESLRRAEKKSASYLPSWRAAKLLECGLPDDPPPPPSKSVTQRLFLAFCELQVRVDGVGATSRHRDAVDVAVRESTCLAREPRQFRDGINQHRSPCA